MLFVLELMFYKDVSWDFDVVNDKNNYSVFFFYFCVNNLKCKYDL